MGEKQKKSGDAGQADISMKREVMIAIIIAVLTTAIAAVLFALMITQQLDVLEGRRENFQGKLVMCVLRSTPYAPMAAYAGTDMRHW